MNYKTEAEPKATASGVPVFCAHDAIEPIEKLVPNPKNPNNHPADQIALLARIITSTGWRQPITVSTRSGFIVKGHGRLMAAKEAGLLEVPVDYQNYATEAEEYADLVADNRIAELAEIDKALLADIFKDIDPDEIPVDLTGYNEAEFNEILQMFANVDAEKELTDIQDVNEVPEPEDLIEPVTRPGDVWILNGRHRIMCGDSTDPHDVAILADGKKADFLHADPPYGMGKEGEGIKNDNLRGERLLAFQMKWYKAFRPHTKEKIGVAIWGNSKELWQLFFFGLDKAEKIRFTNEIVWDKPDQAGKSYAGAQSIPRSERCLLIQTGDQVLGSVNSEYFPDSLRPLLTYMKGEAEAVGLNRKTLKEITGNQMFSHYFSESQFAIPSAANYKKLQAAYPGHFLRPYDEIAAEFKENGAKSKLIENGDIERAYCDISFEIFNDVWTCPMTRKDELLNHATPKHLEIMRRMLKMNCPEGGILLEPFIGSGQTLLASEQTRRVCYGMEIEPKYVDMAVMRFIVLTESHNVKLIRDGKEQPREVIADILNILEQKRNPDADQGRLPL